ncbi:hypothetical protein [uncultured Gammaproteobacteria bacterium]|nr:hypothetical protein [uncultured Gammaproteobacteria bacterium]
MYQQKYLTRCCIGKTTRLRSHFSADKGVRLINTMMLNTKLLFELHVYRIDESTYYEQFSEYKDSNSSEYFSSDSPYHIENFGGQWEYNEIIGFLKFYVSGNTQIRNEYFETDSKRKVKTRKKVFVKKNDSFSVSSINRSMTNDDLIKTINSSIQHCENNLPKNRFINTEIFFSTYKNTDWYKVIYPKK